MHNFENFAKVKFRDILLTGTGHRDRRLNRDCPSQTGTYGRSTYSDKPHQDVLTILKILVGTVWDFFSKQNTVCFG